MANFYSIITNRGKELEAEALASGTKITLVKFVVGDGNGQATPPKPTQTKLVNEKYRGDIGELSVSPEQSTQMMAKIVLPTDVGGFTVREIGILTDAGELYAVANCAAIEKPVGGVSVNMQFRLAVSDTANITLNVATGDGLFLRIDQDLSEIRGRGAQAQKAARESLAIVDASTKQKGLVQLNSATNSTSETQSATPAAVKATYDLANAKYTAQDATTARKGIVQLNSATNSDSETLAATPKAIKITFDKALAAEENAKTANDNANTRLEKNKNLSDVPDKGKARASLELVKQTSPTDTTSGALLLNGGWGVGGYTIKSEIGLTGFFSLGAGSSENPDGNGFAHINMAVSGFYATRLAVSYAGAVPTAFLQTINGDTKNAWMPLLTSDNGLVKASNLSDVPNKETARNNLQLGDSATKNVGTIKNTVAAGDDNRIVGAMQKTNNLADLEDKATSRSNLGLGTAATKNVGIGAGNVMEVGARGWGALAPNGATDTVTSVYWGAVGATFNPESSMGYAHLNIAVSNTYRVRLAIQYSEGKSKVYVQNIGAAYGEWVQFYTTANKPTAADVGAIEGVQLGAEVMVSDTTVSTGNRTIKAPSGAFISGIIDVNNTLPEVKDVDAILTRVLQIKVNGAWRTVIQQ